MSAFQRSKALSAAMAMTVHGVCVASRGDMPARIEAQLESVNPSTAGDNG